VIDYFMGEGEAGGEYCTKRAILEIYDELQKAIESGEPYQTLLWHITFAPI
jgi:hypothetical protein